MTRKGSRDIDQDAEAVYIPYDLCCLDLNIEPKFVSEGNCHILCMMVFFYCFMDFL